MDFTINNSYRFTPNYQQFILNNLSYLNSTLTDKEIKTITEDQTIAFKGDFYGVLAALGIDSSMFYVIAALNDVSDATMFDGLGMVLKIPSGVTLTKLDKMYLATGL